VSQPWWAALLREQHAAGFPDVEGAEGSLRLPVSDRFLNRLIAQRIPPAGPIGQVDVQAEAGNQLKVRVRLARPSFLPAFTVRLRIERQPQLPDSPVIGFRLLSEGLAALAGPAMRFFEVLPKGIYLAGDLLTVDLATLVEQQGAGEAFRHIRHLELTTEPGRLIVSARAALP
jgi:hypothetical protein